MSGERGEQNESIDAERLAREDWERRIYLRLTDESTFRPDTHLAAPGKIIVEPGAGHVRLDWTRVDGAAGYVIERTGPDGEPRVLLHGGSDVPAVPGPPFADTGVEDGTTYIYRVAAVLGADFPAQEWSEPVEGATSPGRPDALRLTVDPTKTRGKIDRVWRMVGSERLTQLLMPDIQDEFAAALRTAKQDLGVSHVRAHAILHDDNQVVRRTANGLEFDFATVDKIYDKLIDLGLRPLVELSFMPAALARNPEETVFAYRGIISPPRDWREWHRLIHELAQHLVDRYGLDEVADWPFEVWNEPNLVVFWAGTQQEYFRLYDESARAIKQVSERLQVGGPSTAATEWVEALAEHAEKEGIPLDFLTSHTYGNLPLDVRPALERHGFKGIPVWWTEWGVGHSHFGPIHDLAAGAPFVLSGYQDVQGRMDALAYWVISDHFEELGRPQKLFHNGFGLLTIGNLRKPRYWAAHLAAHQGEEILETRLEGDGADVLVRAWATRHPDGTIDVLLWNGTVNADLMHGDPRLHRTVRIEGLTGNAAINKIDAHHSNLLTAHDGADWPDDAGLQRLRAADRLHEEPLEEPVIELPQPGVARIRFVPRTEEESRP